MRKLYLLVILPFIFHGNVIFAQKISTEFDNSVKIKNFLLEFIDYADLFLGNAQNGKVRTGDPQKDLENTFYGYFCNPLTVDSSCLYEPRIINFMDQENQKKMNSLIKKYKNQPLLYDSIMSIDNILISPKDYVSQFWYTVINNGTEGKTLPSISSRIWINKEDVYPWNNDNRLDGNTYQKAVDCVIRITATITDNSVVPPRRYRSNEEYETRFHINYTKRRGVIVDSLPMYIDKIEFRPLQPPVIQSNYLARVEISGNSILKSNPVIFNSLKGISIDEVHKSGLDINFIVRHSSLDKTSAKLSLIAGIGYQNLSITNSIDKIDFSAPINTDDLLFGPDNGASLNEFILTSYITNVKQHNSFNLLKLPIGIQVEKPLKGKNKITLDGRFGICGNLVISKSWELVESGNARYTGTAIYTSPLGKDITVDLDSINLPIYISQSDTLFLKEYSLTQINDEYEISSFGGNLFFDIGTTIYNKYENLGFRISVGSNYTLVPLGITQLEPMDLVDIDKMKNLLILSNKVGFNDFHFSFGLIMHLAGSI